MSTSHSQRESSNSGASSRGPASSRKKSKKSMSGDRTPRLQNEGDVAPDDQPGMAIRTIVEEIKRRTSGM